MNKKQLPTKVPKERTQGDSSYNLQATLARINDKEWTWEPVEMEWGEVHEWDNAMEREATIRETDITKLLRSNTLNLIKYKIYEEKPSILTFNPDLNIKSRAFIGGTKIKFIIHENTKLQQTKN